MIKYCSMRSFSKEEKYIISDMHHCSVCAKLFCFIMIHEFIARWIFIFILARNSKLNM